ncbi:transcriptional regulator, XRE family [Methylobacterium sp. 4-46]|uniref:helix-turn-helix domain-containing protein n=1 Tax=unclassified Methylobacterium TaxID=2615210 RepID=UPI000152C038|nr:MULTISPECIES: XRE family transcriptional regulator [Methylobacterium]ACA19098.1 transcriptional regulator, XRE family [Methylobacterium sp. 4-46]WFT78310.1 XRE family transcriptional regulator [Methylobacterium nodulans]
MESSSDLDGRLAARLRALRAERGLTLDALAERSGVSRSMISLVERAESSPTATVLERLAAGLGVPLAALFAAAAREDASPLCRRAEQSCWRDPGTGYRRRNLSPPSFASPLQLVEVEIPPGATVAYDSLRVPPLEQQVVVLDGALTVTLGESVHHLGAGDCLAMRVDRPVAFHNPADQPARTLVAIAAGSLPR